MWKLGNRPQQSLERQEGDVRSGCFGNVTEYGPTVRKFVSSARAHRRYEAYLFAETHTDVEAARSMEAEFDEVGIAAVASQAVATGRGGTTGGTLAGILKHHQSSTYRSWGAPGSTTSAINRVKCMAPSIRSRAAGLDFDQWTHNCLHFGGVDVVLIAAYFTPCVGMAGPNLRRMASIGAFLSMISDPWLMLADFNIAPTIMKESDWPDKMEGK